MQCTQRRCLSSSLTNIRSFGWSRVRFRRARDRAREKERQGEFKGRGGRGNRVPPVKRGWWTPLTVGSSPIHLGVLRTNTRVRMRACNLHADLVHVHVSVLSPLAINTSAFTAVAFRVNATRWNASTIALTTGPAQHPLRPPPIFSFQPLLHSSKRARGCVCHPAMLDRRANDDQPNDACVHTRASTHSASSLMLAHSTPHVRHCNGRIERLVTFTVNVSEYLPWVCSQSMRL